MIIKHSEVRIDKVYSDCETAEKEIKEQANIEEKSEEKDEKEIEKITPEE
jgi:hypothetical protein